MHILTIIYSIDLINKSLVGELCSEGGQEVNVTVQEKKSIKHR